MLLTVTVVGVYGTNHNHSLAQIFDTGLTVRLGQAPVHNRIDQLLAPVAEGKAVLDDVITHNLPPSEAPHGYAILDHERDD